MQMSAGCRKPAHKTLVFVLGEFRERMYVMAKRLGSAND